MYKPRRGRSPLPSSIREPLFAWLTQVIGETELFSLGFVLC